jgi:hypothetical protein
VATRRCCGSCAPSRQGGAPLAASRAIASGARPVRDPWLACAESWHGPRRCVGCGGTAAASEWESWAARGARPGECGSSARWPPAIPARDALDLFEEGELELLRLPEQPHVPAGQVLSPQRGASAVRVRGDSLVAEGILAGDCVLMAPSPAAQGTIAVAAHHSANGGRAAATLVRPRSSGGMSTRMTSICARRIPPMPPS